MGQLRLAGFALAVSWFMTTLVDEDGEKIVAFLVILAAFGIAFFATRDGGELPCEL